MTTRRLRPLLDEQVLQRAKQELELQLAHTPDDHASRAQVIEALLWIDRGVYGGCSVCGDTLSNDQVLRRPADKVCPLCRSVARRVTRVAAERRAAAAPLPSLGSLAHCGR